MRLIRSLLLLTGLLLIPLSPLFAQSQGYTNLPLGAVLTNTARVPGSYASSTMINAAGNGLFCTLTQTSEVGNPSTVFTIDTLNAVTNTWQTVATSAAVDNTANASGKSVILYPGAVASSVPTGLAVFGLKLPYRYRINEVVTGGTSTTGSINCDLLN